MRVRAEAGLLRGLLLPVSCLALVLALLDASAPRLALAGVAAFALAGALLARARPGAAAAAGIAACLLVPYGAIWTRDPRIDTAAPALWLALALVIAGLALPPRRFALLASAHWLLLAGSLLAASVLSAASALRLLAFTACLTVMAGLHSRASARPPREDEGVPGPASRPSRERAELLSRMSHELRAPLDVIAGMGELLEHTALSREQRDYAEAIRRSAGRLLRLVEEVLDASRPESGEAPAPRTSFPLSTLLGDTARAVAPHAEEKGLALVCDAGADLPDRVLGDPDGLRRALERLLDDAIELGGRGEVLLSAARAEGAGPGLQVAFSVSGSGIGIAAPEQPRTLDPLTLLDSSLGREQEGAGLGLAIAARLVARMGGRIRVAGSPGSGAQFSFAIPLEPDPAPPPPDEPTAALEGLPVLVLEGQPGERRVLGELLRSLGMEPTLAGDVASALTDLRAARAAGRPYALALVDSSMRGTAAFRGRRNEDDPAAAGTPQILLWSQVRGLAGAREDAPRLLKPVTRADLLAAVRQALGGAGAKASGEGSEARPPRLLVIEPSPVSAMITARLAELAGYDAAVVGSPAEAPWALRDQAFDAVLFDASSADHRACLAQLREERPDLAIVALVPENAGGAEMHPEDLTGATLLRAPLGAPELKAALERARKASAAAGGAGGAPFDRGRLVKNLGDDEDAARQVLDQFVRQAEGALLSLREASGSGDLRSLQQAAHRLKGALLWIAADRAAETAGRVEALARDGEAARAQEALAALEREVHAVVNAVRGETGPPAA